MNNRVQFYDHINVLIKPTDGCNLRCKYCFHKDFGYDSNHMSFDTLKHFFDITMPHYNSMSIVWHGGEPTFVGEELFNMYSSLANSYAEKYGIRLSQSMQTNGTLLNQRFIDVLLKQKVSIGISYDGPINDVTRKSTEKLMLAHQVLQMNNIDYGCIVVVSGLNVDALLQLYNHMKDINKPFQINPYIDTSVDALPELDMSPESFINAMEELFELWLNDETCEIEVDPFMRMIHDCYLGCSSLCARSSCMRNWFCLNVDGTLSPCDRDFPKEYCYGNVREYEDIREMYNSEGYKHLIQKAIIRRAKCQKTCNVYKLCEGGCNNNALYEVGLEHNGGFSCIVTKALLNMVSDAINDYDLFGSNPKTKNPTLINWLNENVHIE